MIPSIEFETGYPCIPFTGEDVISVSASGAGDSEATKPGGKMAWESDPSPGLDIFAVGLEPALGLFNGVL